MWFSLSTSHLLKVSQTAEDAAKKISEKGEYIGKTEAFQKVSEVGP